MPFLTLSRSILLVLVTGASTTIAHDFVNHWNVNGVDQPSYTPFSPKATAQRVTNNLQLEWDEYDSPEVACGGVADSAEIEFYPLDAGSTVTVFWNNWPGHPDKSSDVLEYMAYCGDSCQGKPSASLDWFKISELVLENGDWASNGITARPGHDRSFKIPSDLAPGDYLVRHEIIAMHGIGAPQVYPVCFQARLSGSGTAIPTDTVKFPAAYNINDDFKTYNIYDASKDHSQFVPPGLPVYQGGGGGAAVPAPSGGHVTAVAPSSSATGTSGSGAAAAPSSAVPRTSGSAPSSVPRPATSAAAPAVSSGGAGNTGAGASAPGPAPGPSRFPSQGGNDCYVEMNTCKDKANKELPNGQVEAGLAACDAQYQC